MHAENIAYKGAKYFQYNFYLSSKAKAPGSFKFTCTEPLIIAELISSMHEKLVDEESGTFHPLRDCMLG